MAHKNILNLARAVAALSLGLAAQAGLCQEYPSRPVRMIVPFSAGGTTDATARVVGQALEKIWKQPVIVENKPGGSQLVGADYIKTQPADGYTLIMYAQSLAYQDLMAKTTFNLLNDTVPVAIVAGSGYLITVASTVPAKSLKELIAYAKSRPGKVNEGTVGTVGVPEIRKLWLDMGVDIQVVPYKGGANTITALAAGEVDIYGASPLDVAELTKTGKVVPLAYTETGRHPAFPNVPTVAEALQPGFESRFLFAMSALKGVPQAVVTRINNGVVFAVETPEVKAKFDNLGLRSYKDTPEGVRVTLEKTRKGAQGLIAAGILKPDL